MSQQTIPVAGEPVAVKFLGSNREVIAGYADGRVRFHEIGVATPTRELVHGDTLRQLATTPDGSRIISAGGGVVRVWNRTSDTPLSEMKTNNAATQWVGCSADGTRVASACGTVLQLWKIDSSGAEELVTRRLDSRILSTMYSKNGQKLAASTTNGQFVIVDTAGGSFLMDRQIEAVRALAFDPQGNRILVANGLETARILDAGSGEPLTHVLQHGTRFAWGAFDHTGDLAMTAGVDGSICVWDATSGELVLRCATNRDELASAGFCLHDGAMVTCSPPVASRLLICVSCKTLSMS